MEKNRLKLNIISPLFNKFIGLIYSFVIPRFFILTYSSDVNGIVASIGNFLSILSLLDMGIGAVVQSSMYKPLFENDNTELSKVIKSSRKFFYKISLVFVAYVLVISVVYPTFIRKDFSFFFEFFLILIIALDSYSKTYMGCTNNILITADQKVYLLSFFQTIFTCVSFVITYLLIKMNVSIHFVMFASAITYSIKPLLIRFYVKKHYTIDKAITYENEPIKQKWNGFAQNLAYYVTTNTDVFVLTIFSSLSNVSIYYVYNMVVSGISNVIITAQSGIPPMLGKYIASKDNDGLKKTFESYELILHSIVTFVYSCTLILLVPFIKVYTKEIIDADYIQPIFAVLITFALFAYTLRYPYHALVIAAGHFKQTQTSSIIEMLLNVSITLICVFKLGLPGVAVGTLISIVYRTIYLVLYLPKINIKLSPFHSLKLIVSDLIIIIITYLLCSSFELSKIAYSSWLFLAFKVSAVSFIVTLLIMTICNYKYFKNIIIDFKKRVIK